MTPKPLLRLACLLGYHSFGNTWDSGSMPTGQFHEKCENCKQDFWWRDGYLPCKLNKSNLPTE